MKAVLVLISCLVFASIVKALESNDEGKIFLSGFSSHFRFFILIKMFYWCCQLKLQNSTTRVKFFFFNSLSPPFDFFILIKLFWVALSTKGLRNSTMKVKSFVAFRLLFLSLSWLKKCWLVNFSSWKCGIQRCEGKKGFCSFSFDFSLFLLKIFRFSLQLCEERPLDRPRIGVSVARWYSI